MPNTDAYRSQIPDVMGLREVLSNGLAEQWRFLAVMPELGNIQVNSNYNFSGGGAAYTSNTNQLSRSQIPNAIAESVDIPAVQLDMDQRYGQGTSISVPRKVNYSNITINFYEDQLYNVTKYLLGWRSLIFDGTSLFNVPTVYKKDIDIWAFDSMNNYAPVLIINCIEVAPTTFVGGLSYGQNNGFLTVSSEFSVDDMEMQFPTRS